MKPVEETDEDARKRIFIRQTAGNPRKRKNSFRQKKCGRIFCLLRQMRLQPAVTYVYVSSLGCKLASLPCRVFQRLAKRRLCQRFETDEDTSKRIFIRFIAFFMRIK